MREEAFAEFPDELVRDMEVALSLARRYTRDRRPAGWTWDLTVLVNQAELAVANHRRSKEKAAAAERLRRQDGDRT